MSQSIQKTFLSISFPHIQSDEKPSHPIWQDLYSVAKNPKNGVALVRWLQENFGGLYSSMKVQVSPLSTNVSDSYPMPIIAETMSFEEKNILKYVGMH